MTAAETRAPTCMHGKRVKMPHGGFRIVPPPKITDQQIAEAYSRLGSVWAAGRDLGMAGQTIHKRMRKSGTPTTPIRVLTNDEAQQIRAYYETTPPDLFWLPDLAAKLGRADVSIARYAKKMGLTCKGRPHNAETRARQASAMVAKWKRQPHPRGALGMVHTPGAIAKMSEASKQTWALSKTFGIIHMSPEARDARSLAGAKRMALRPASKSHTRAAGGKRDDIGDTWFRSSWEANYARYLNLLMKMKLVDSWEFEPETFWFEGVKRGTVSYLPDFKVMYRNDPKPEYVEIKGWVTPKDRTKWKRMKKHHPHIKLVVLAQKEYRDIENKWASAIPNWERGARAAAKFSLMMGKQVPSIKEPAP